MINLECIVLFQEFNQFGRAVNRFMEHANSTQPDLHIAGWTTQSGQISYPHDYNYDSNKGQTDSNLSLLRSVHIDLLNVSNSRSLPRNSCLANINLVFTVTGS